MTGPRGLHGLRGLRTDARLAWSLLNGSPRSERWRLSLTALGAMTGTGFVLAALVVTAIDANDGYEPDGLGGVMVYHPYYTNGLINEPGLRPGVTIALLLLLLPVLAFLAQCTRIGALHRERRLAALRLAGATPRQVRRITALETGTVSGLGALAGLAGFVALRAVLGAAQHGRKVLTWPTDVPLPWGWIAVVVAGVPLLAALGARLSLRRVEVDPMGLVRRGRRHPPRPGRVRVALWSLAPLALIAGTGGFLAIVGMGVGNTPGYTYGMFVALAVATIALVVVGLLFGTAGLAVLSGRLAARSRRPALLLAGERLQADPWAGARAHAAVLLTALIGVGFMGLRRMRFERLEQYRRLPFHNTADDAFFHGAYDLVGLALLIALGVTISGLAVGTAESVMTRRRTLAAMAATGVPRSVLNRVVLLETLLPLAPAVLVASVCSLTVLAASVSRGESMPLLEPLLTAAGLLAAALLATAASLPLLRRTVHPAELRYE